MKKVFLAVCTLVGMAVCGYAQEPLQVKQEGKNFVQVQNTKSKSEPVNTGYTFTDSKGVTYPIFMGSSGSCFIVRVSKKTGNEYRMYLGEEVSKKICSALGHEYKPKNK